MKAKGVPGSPSSNNMRSSTSSTSTNKENWLSPRLLAQDAVNLYMEELDPHESHPTNVKAVFRPVVLALTCFIMDGTKRPTWTDYLQQQQQQQQEEQGSIAADVAVEHKLVYTNGGKQDEKKEANNDDDNNNTATTAELPELDRRCMSRLNAFLNGLIWAVPASPTTGVASSAKNKNNKPHQPLLSSSSSPPSSPKKPVPKKADSAKTTTPTSSPSRSSGQGLSLMDGLSGFKGGSALTGRSLLRSISNTGSTSGGGGGGDQNSLQYPQIRSLDLGTRLELYLRTLFRVAKQTPPQSQPCVLAAEPSRALKARAEAIVAAFANTVNSVKQQAPVLTRLITYMTMELLAVSCLSETCKGAIKRVVVEYEHQTSFASLAFLSSPEDAADQNLLPLLNRYFSTLKENWETAVRDCELEDMLQSVLDPEMRHFFKTVEFTSIGHLLETCNDFRDRLQTIELPPPVESQNNNNTTQLQDEGQIRQAIRDLQRERIRINGNLLPPVTSRTELIKLMSQTLNSATLTPNTKSGRRRRRRRHKKGVRRSESAPALNSLENQEEQEMRSQRDEEESLSSATESDGSTLGGRSSTIGGRSSTIGGRSSTGGGSSTISRGRSFDLTTVDLLTKRLLLAASRTGLGGDAYFIVRDLFGGKDVQVLASQDLRGAGGSPTTTLELWLHLGSLTIQCHTSFDVYPLLKDGRGRNDPYSIVDHCEPLIQLHTTTTEVISLHEVRAADAENDMPPSKNNAGGGYPDNGGHFVLQERMTDRTGWRTLSIRPALYEKLQVWTTPS